MIDYIEALRNLREGESIDIPQAVHRLLRPDPRRPQTRSTRVDQETIRHTYVGPPAGEAPEAPPSDARAGIAALRAKEADKLKEKATRDLQEQIDLIRWVTSE